MKNLIKLIGTLAIAFFIMTTPAHSFALNTNTAVTDSETLNIQTKYIKNYKVYFPKYLVLPESYYYNVGGWKGWLDLTDEGIVGDYKIGYYSGYVSCSGFCAME